MVRKEYIETDQITSDAEAGMLHSMAMSPSRMRHKNAPHQRYWYGAGAGWPMGMQDIND
jgi:hypothetical protein